MKPGADSGWDYTKVSVDTFVSTFGGLRREPRSSDAQIAEAICTSRTDRICVPRWRLGVWLRYARDFEPEARGHIYELGQRLRAHLMHHTPSVRFHRNFAD